MIQERIKNFTELKTWQFGHQIVLEVYFLTKFFPREERFGLTNQLRRAAVSVTSNIAEGFSRATSKDKSHFYTIALGSLTEVQNQLIIARDLGYIAESTFVEITVRIVETIRMTQGLVKSAFSRISP